MITKFKIFELLKQKMTPTQSNLIYLPEFKNWFGDWEKNPQSSSKVVDKDGEPKIMWHGSDAIKDINIFKSSKGHDYNFFASDKYESLRYTKDIKNIKPFFINSRKIYNPQKLNEKETKDAKELLTQMDYIEWFIFKFGDDEALKEYSFDLYDKVDYMKLMWSIFSYSCDNYIILETKHFQEYIKNNGYDSFMTLEGYEGNIAVYNPCNIKIANGTNKTFDKNNPDIRK